MFTRTLALFSRVCIATVLTLFLSTFASAQCTLTKVKFKGDNCIDGTYSVSLAGKSASASGEGCGYKGTNSVEAELKPGKDYTLSSKLTSGNKICTTHVLLESKGCYSIFVNGKDRGQSVSLDGSSGNMSWTIRLGSEPAPASPAGSGGNQFSGANCKAPNLENNNNNEENNNNTENPAPAPQTPKNEKAESLTSLGNLINGTAAGELKAGINLATAEGVSLSSFSIESRFQDQFTIVKNTENQLQQIRVPDALITLTETGVNEVTVRYYQPSAIASNNEGSFQLAEGATPYVEQIFRNPNGDKTKSQYIKKQGGIVVADNTVDYDSDTGSASQIQGNSFRKVTETIDAANHTRTVTEIVCAYNNGTIGAVLSKSRQVYTQYLIGERLTQSIQDPDGEALTSTYTYYVAEEDKSHARYGETKTSTSPDGSWSKYEYNNEGKVSRLYRPWKDTPATAEEATTSNCQLVETSYTGAGRFSTKLGTRTTKVLGKIISKVNHSYSTATEGGEKIEVTTTNRGVSNPYRSIDKSYHYEASEHLQGRSYSSESAEGILTSYKYETGTINSGVFTTDASSTTAEQRGQDRREIMTNGTVEHPKGIAYKTTRSVSLYDNEQMLSQQTQVYTGGDNYETISETTYQYDSFNNTIRTRTNGRITNESFYNFDRLSSTKDATGQQTLYNYDIQGRIISTTLKGINGQADRVTSSTQDALGRTISTTITAGDLTRTSSIPTYDSLGRMATSTSSTGVVTSYSYDIANRTNTITSPGGRTQISSSYLDGRSKSSTGTGLTPSFNDYEVDEEGNQITISRVGDPDSPRYTKSFTNTYGQNYRTQRPSPSNQPDSLIVSSSIYDSVGRMSSQSTTGTSTIHYTYDQLGNSLTVSREILGEAGQGLDSLAESRQYYEKVEGNWFQVSENWLLDEEGEPMLKTKNSNQLSGLPITTLSKSISVSASGVVTTGETTLDRATQTLTSTSKSSAITGVFTQISVGGLLTQSKSPTASQPSLYTYDALRRQLTVSAPGYGTTTTTYEPNTDRVKEVTPALGAVISYSYYPATHHAADQLKTTTQTSGEGTNQVTRTTHYDYDLKGNLIRQWGSGTYPMEYGYDAYNQKTMLKTYRKASGWDNPTWPTDTGIPDGTSWTYQESTGLLLKKTDAAGNEMNYTYYPSGQLKRRTWARGSYVEHHYSLDGLLIKKDYSDTTPDVTYTRNRLGQVVQIKDGAGVIQYDFNNLGLKTAERYTVGLLKDFKLARAYDTATRPTQLQVNYQDAIKHQVNYAYEPVAGRLSSVSPSEDWKVNYNYSSTTGQRTGLNHQVNDTTFLTQKKTFDTAGRLLSINHHDSNNIVLNGYSYQLDDFGQRTKATLHDSSFWSYQYDSKGQLIDATKKNAVNAVILGSVLQAQYDGIGNPTSRKKGGGHLSGSLREYTLTMNALNQLTNRTVPAKLELLGQTPANSVKVNGATATRQNNVYGIEVPVDNASSAKQVELNIEASLGSKSATKTLKRNHPAANQAYSYDADGNLLNDGIWAHTWDSENRLVSSEYLLASNDTEKQKYNYVYDYQSRRILKRDLKWNSTNQAWYAHKQTKYIYDGWNCVAEILNEVTLWKKHTWGLDLTESMQGGGGVGGLLSTENVLKNYAAALTYDGNGNVSTLVEKGTNNLLAHYEYTAFGRTLTKSGKHANDNAYRFSTKPQENHNDWYYYGYRYYDPVIGRWPSRDPIEEAGGVNLYAFVGNSPVNRSDRLGLYPGLAGHGDPISPDGAADLIEDTVFQATVNFQENLKGIQANPYMSRDNYIMESTRMNQFIFSRIIRFTNNSGGAINTGDGNRFVFTCKYGWIDMGHFFRNAYGAYALSVDTMEGFSTNFEAWQELYYSDSAWAVEDLSSNDLGRSFGSRIKSLDPNAFDAFNNGRPARVRDFEEIDLEWDDFLIDAGAVKWGTGITIGGKSVEQRIQEDLADYRALGASRPYARSISAGIGWQKKQKLWKCICGGDQPKIPELRYDGGD